MAMVVNARLGRAALVGLVLVLVALSRPSGLSAQNASNQWDGSFERLSSTAEYAWPPDPAVTQVSRHAISADGRWAVFTLEVPNGHAPFRQFFKRDRQYGQLQAFFGAQAAAPPVISADGNHIALETCEGWWRNDQASMCDVYILGNDAFSGLVNASTALDGTESNAPSSEPMLSRNGRFLVFRTDSTTLLPPGVAPGQIVLRDRDTDGNGVFDEPGAVAIQVVSVSSSGDAGNAPSGAAQVSADGRFIAFRSLASNLVPNDNNTAWDVFLHDRQSGETRRINVGWDGQEATPIVDSAAIAMSENGDFVAFATDDAYLTNPPTHFDDFNDALDVIVYDRQAGTLQRVNIGVNGTLGNGHTFWPTFSADGRYLSVLSLATNTEEPSTVTPGRAHVYVVDRVTNQTSRITRTTGGGEPDADAANAGISADGSVVVFISQATNLAGGALGVDSFYSASHLHVTPESVTVSARGGEVTLNISAHQYAAWTLELSDSTWLYAGTTWGIGPGSVTLYAYVNQDAVDRSVSVRIGGQTILVTQQAGLSLASATPSSGPATGATVVTLTGTGFEPDMTVYFDGLVAPFELVDSTTVRATAPPHAPGFAAIALLTTDYRFAYLESGFEYLDTTPDVTWSAPRPIVYGTALSDTQLNAQASVAGHFEYSPTFGTVLPAGLHTLTVTFTPADPLYSVVTSAVTLEVAKATPQVTVTGGTFVYSGTPHGATGTASGVGGVALGPLTFTYNGAVALPVNAGEYAVMATFAGDANYTAASAAATMTIVPAPLVIRADDAVKRFGAPLPTFAATGTGFVKGESFASLSGTLAFSTTATALSAVGSYPIAVSGVSSPNYAVTFQPGTLTIIRGAVVVGVTTAPEPSGYDQPMTFTVIVAAAQTSPVAPAGNVQFFDGSRLLGAAPLTGGTASLSTAGLAAGGHGIEAHYEGDASFEPGSATSLHLIRTASDTPALTLSSSRNPSNVGQNVTLAADVTTAGGPVVTGSVQFYSGSTLLGEFPISGGRAAFLTSSLPAGSHAITARFMGGSGLPPARSAVFVQAVGAPSWRDRPTTMTLSSSPNPAALGDSVTLTATVTGLHSALPVGRVLFMVNGTVYGDDAGLLVTPGVGSSATVVLPVSGLAHGIHTITATYLGDPIYKGSTAAVMQVVK